MHLWRPAPLVLGNQSRNHWCLSFKVARLFQKCRTKNEIVREKIPTSCNTIVPQYVLSPCRYRTCGGRSCRLISIGTARCFGSPMLVIGIQKIKATFPPLEFGLSWQLGTQANRHMAQIRGRLGRKCSLSDKKPHRTSLGLDLAVVGESRRHSSHKCPNLFLSAD